MLKVKKALDNSRANWFTGLMNNLFGSKDSEKRNALVLDEKIKDRITKLSYADAEKIQLISKQNYIGWNMFQDRENIIDGGSIWSLEKDEKTGQEFLIKQIDQAGNLVRKLKAQQKEASINKKADETITIMEDLGNLSEQELLERIPVGSYRNRVDGETTVIRDGNSEKIFEWKNGKPILISKASLNKKANTENAFMDSLKAYIRNAVESNWSRAIGAGFIAEDIKDYRILTTTEIQVYLFDSPPHGKSYVFDLSDSDFYKYPRIDAKNGPLNLREAEELLKYLEGNLIVANFKKESNKEYWEMSFPEFSKIKAQGDFDPNIIADGYIFHVEEALKENKPVPQENIEQAERLKVELQRSYRPEDLKLRRVVEDHYKEIYLDDKESKMNTKFEKIANLEIQKEFDFTKILDSMKKKGWKDIYSDKQKELITIEKEIESGIKLIAKLHKDKGDLILTKRDLEIKFASQQLRLPDILKIVKSDFDEINVQIKKAEESPKYDWVGLGKDITEDMYSYWNEYYNVADDTPIAFKTESDGAIGVYIADSIIKDGYRTEKYYPLEECYKSVVEPGEEIFNMVQQFIKSKKIDFHKGAQQDSPKYNSLEEAKKAAEEFKTKSGKEYEPKQSDEDSTKFEVVEKIAEIENQDKDELDKIADAFVEKGFTDGADASAYISLFEYGTLRNPQTDETMMMLVPIDYLNSIDEARFSKTKIDVNEVKSELEKIGDGFYNTVGQNKNEYMSYVRKEYLSGAIMDLRMYKGIFEEPDYFNWDIEDLKRFAFGSEKQSHLKQATGMIKTIDEAKEYLALYNENIEQIGTDQYRLIDKNDGRQELWNSRGIIDKANEYWEMYEKKYSNANLKAKKSELDKYKNKTYIVKWFGLDEKGESYILTQWNYKSAPEAENRYNQILKEHKKEIDNGEQTLTVDIDYGLNKQAEQQELEIGQKVVTERGDEGVIAEIYHIKDVYKDEEEFKQYQELYSLLDLDWNRNDIISAIVKTPNKAEEEFLVNEIRPIEFERESNLNKKANTIRLEEGDYGTYLIVNDDGRDLLIQTDFEFPTLAQMFGWRGMEDDIEGAREYLDMNIGKEVEDLGYFEKEKNASLNKKAQDDIPPPIPIEPTKQPETKPGATPKQTDSTEQYNITVLITGKTKQLVDSAIEELKKQNLVNYGIDINNPIGITSDERGYVQSFEANNIQKSKVDELSRILSDAEHKSGVVEINIGAVQSKTDKKKEKKTEEKESEEKKAELQKEAIDPIQFAKNIWETFEKAGRIFTDAIKNKIKQWVQTYGDMLSVIRGLINAIKEVFGSQGEDPTEIIQAINEATYFSPSMATLNRESKIEKIHIDEAIKLIEADDPIIYDVASNLGQMVGNIKHTDWFIDRVADYLKSMEILDLANLNKKAEGLKEWDYVKVNLNLLEDKIEPYVNLIKKEIRNGGGLLQIYSIEGDKANCFAADTMSYIMGGVYIPLGALVFVKDGEPPINKMRNRNKNPEANFKKKSDESENPERKDYIISYHANRSELKYFVTTVDDSRVLGGFETIEDAHQAAIEDMSQHNLLGQTIWFKDYEKGLMIKYKSASLKKKSDEEETSVEYNGPDPGDYVMNDSGSLGSKTSVSIMGERFLGEFDSIDEALNAIKADMEKNKFFSNVWQLSDHGNLENVTHWLNGTEINASSEKESDKITYAENLHKWITQNKFLDFADSIDQQITDENINHIFKSSILDLLKDEVGKIKDVEIEDTENIGQGDKKEVIGLFNAQFEDDSKFDGAFYSEFQDGQLNIIVSDRELASVLANKKKKAGINEMEFGVPAEDGITLGDLYSELVALMENELDVSTSDAQGILDAQGDWLREKWEQGERDVNNLLKEFIEKFTTASANKESNIEKEIPMDIDKDDEVKKIENDEEDNIEKE